MNITRFPSL